MTSACVAHSSCFPLTQDWEGRGEDGVQKYPYPFGREKKIWKRDTWRRGGRGRQGCWIVHWEHPTWLLSQKAGLRQHSGTCSEVSLPEQQPGPRTTEGLSRSHLCQECAVFAPDFDLTLIPQLVGDHNSGPFGWMIRMRERRYTGAGGVVPPDREVGGLSSLGPFLLAHLLVNLSLLVF